MKIQGTKLLKDSRWVQFKKKVYLDKQGKMRSWEYLERKNRQQAAFVIALSRDQRRLLLIKQYRLPFENYVIEFPAGLIDQGEGPAETAGRELLEETGYRGKVLSVSPSICLSAGMISETAFLVRMEVDLDHPPEKQGLESSEDITVLNLELSQLPAKLREYSRQGLIVDAKIWSFLEGLSVSPTESV